MFSPHSAYEAMGFEFINEPGAWLALPIDKKMFTYIMAKAVAWGMIMCAALLLAAPHRAAPATRPLPPLRLLTPSSP